MIFTISEYKDCLSFDDSFKTLKYLEPSKDEKGDFIFSSGRNSVVFKMIDKQTNAFKALKCFINVNEDQLTYIKEVSEYLQYIKSSYVVPYQYFDKELWLASSYEEPQYYPVLLMDWVEGKTMGQHLDVLCQSYDYFKIKDLALAFDQMALWLLHQDFAHGDLKLDNIIVNQSGLPILIDYDGCFIPGMEGTDAQELGTPGYQHPLRDEHFFNKNIDEVGILVISSALHALVKEPELWVKYNNGENLLFTATDLDCPQESLLWEQLIKLDHELVNQRLALLQLELSGLNQVIGLEDLLRLSKHTILFYNQIIFDKKKLIKKSKYDSFTSVIYKKREPKPDDLHNYIFVKYENFGFCCISAIKVTKEGFERMKKGDSLEIPKVCFGNIDIENCSVLWKYKDIDCYLIGISWSDNEVPKKQCVEVTKQRFEAINEDEIVEIPKGSFLNYHPYLIPFVKNNKWGFCNRKKQVIISCGFDYVDFFDNGIAKIGVIEHDFENIKIKYGLINTTGKLIAPCIYDNIGVFSQGLASVCIEKQYGFINVFGKIVVPICYDDAQMFFDDLARVKKYDKYGFIAQDGVEVIPLVYDSASEKFSNGIALVRIGGVTNVDQDSPFEWIGAKWKFIDNTGAKAIVIKDYDIVRDFKDGYAIVTVDWPYENYCSEGVIDNKGKEIIDPRCYGYNCIFSISQDRIIVLNNEFDIICIDFSKKVITKKYYDSISDFSEDYAIVGEHHCVFFNQEEINSNYEVYEKYGFINKEGEEIIPVEYDGASLFSEGLAMVGIDGKYGFVNCHNSIIIPLIYDDAESFCEGLAIVKSNEKFGFINKSGSEVIQLKYECVSSFSNGFAKVKFNGRSFYIDKSGIEYYED